MLSLDSNARSVYVLYLGMGMGDGKYADVLSEFERGSSDLTAKCPSLLGLGVPNH